MSKPRHRLPAPRAGFRKAESENVQVHATLLRQARKSGQLNLSNRQLSEGQSLVLIFTCAELPLGALGTALSNPRFIEISENQDYRMYPYTKQYC